jgi:hypothetical protein
MDDVFGVPLRPDPAIALPRFWSGVRHQVGPIHRLQYVIELVGPRSVPAFAASMLLDKSWFAALGEPQLYCMAAKDVAWQPLTDTRDGAYDSLALCWDFVGPRGVLGSRAAQHLLDTAAKFGEQIQRRALPMPTPSDVDAAVQWVRRAKIELDSGFALLLHPRSGSFDEKSVWICCANLGLEFANGSFVWRDQDSGEVAFNVTPDTEDSFSLGNVQTGRTHGALMLGFHLPVTPNPPAALEGMIEAARRLADRLHGLVLTEEGNPFGPQEEATAKRSVAEAADAMERAGMIPGSLAALKLMGRL